MKNYNILSLDGGGIRGLILLEQLVVLENILGTNIRNKFDLISGTSTGGIIAVLLSLGYSASDLLSIYTIHGENIFKKHFWRFGLFMPKYDDKYFNDLIKKYVDNKELKDLSTDVIIIGYNATLNDKIIFKSKLAKENNTYNYSLFDVIRTTASAPTFFKPYKLRDNNFYVDGGLVINNPTLVSWIEALKYNEKETKINILSFSTGINIKTKLKKYILGGLLNWVKPTVDILLTQQSLIVDYVTSQLFGREPGIYMRCKSIIDKSNGKIDDTSKSNIENMILDGKNSAELNIEKMKTFCNSII